MAPLPPLTRPQVCGRITALRSALELICVQANYDTHGSFACRGAMKVELIALEAALRTMATAEELPVVQYDDIFGLQVPYLMKRGES